MYDNKTRKELRERTSYSKKEDIPEEARLYKHMYCIEMCRRGKMRLAKHAICVALYMNAYR